MLTILIGFIVIAVVGAQNASSSCNQYDAAEFLVDSVKVLKHTTKALEGVHISSVLQKLATVCISCTHYPPSANWTGFLCVYSKTCPADQAPAVQKTVPGYVFPNGPALPFPAGNTCKPQDAAVYVLNSLLKRDSSTPADDKPKSNRAVMSDVFAKVGVKCTPPSDPKGSYTCTT